MAAEVRVALDDPLYDAYISLEVGRVAVALERFWGSALLEVAAANVGVVDLRSPTVAEHRDRPADRMSAPRIPLLTPPTADGDGFRPNILVLFVVPEGLPPAGWRGIAGGFAHTGLTRREMNSPEGLSVDGMRLKTERRSGAAVRAIVSAGAIDGADPDSWVRSRSEDWLPHPQP